MEDKQFYIDAYLKLLERAKNDAPERGLDYSELAWEYETYANTNEVVGFYVFNEKENALSTWRLNTEGIELSQQDHEVTKILERLFA